jgi:hypothetical protein
MGIELPGWLRYVGGLVGEKFPEGDETACRRQADRWNHFADELHGKNDAIEAAAKAALDGFSSGVTHDALVPQLNSLTTGDQSIEKIIEQLRQLAQAVNDAATEIEFAKEMFILNLGILAASLTAMIASAWINWGAPAEMAAAVAATEAVLSQIIRAAIGKIVSEAALAIIERLAISALEGAAMNAAISGGMNAAVQGQQILQGHRRGFDWGSFGKDVEAGAIQGAVAAPFLKGPETRTPGFHPSERLSEFGRSFTGNTLGGLAAQAPSGQFDVANAAKGGLVFGAMDAGRPTPKSIKNDWAGGGTPAGTTPHTTDSHPDTPPARGPELPGDPAHGAEGDQSGSHVDVPLNLGTGDHGGGSTDTTHAGSSDLTSGGSTSAPRGPAEPAAAHPTSSPPDPQSSSGTRTSVSDGGAQATGAPTARSSDSVVPQAPTSSHSGDVGQAPTRADPAPPLGPHEPAEAPAAAASAARTESAPLPDSGVSPRGAGLDPGVAPRGPDLADPSSARAPDRSDAASQRTPDRGPTAPPTRGPDRVDTAPPKPEGARPADGSHPQLDAAKTTSAAHTTDAKPADAKAGSDANRMASDKGTGAQADSAHPSSGSLDPAAFAPLVLGTSLTAGDGAVHGGSAVPHEPRTPERGNVAGPDHAAPQADRGEHPPRAGVAPDDLRDPRQGHVDASTLPDYRQRQMELAVSGEKLERDLLKGGCPPDVAASARHSPYEGMTHQELLERYCNPDGSVRWPPHDGFADGKFRAADRIPEGEPLDRIGEVSPQRGDFMGSAGDPYPARALAPGSSGGYHRLEGTGKPFSRPTWELRYGKVAEAFDQPGGGRQWVVVDTSKIIDGAPQKVLVDQLIKEGYVRVVEPDGDHAHSVVGDETRPVTDRVERLHRLIDEMDNAHVSDRPHEDVGPQRDSDHSRSEHRPLFHGEELTADERHALREVWDGLSPDERRYLYSREPMFGEHAGLPVAECDHYGRQAIADLRHDITERAGRHESLAGDGAQLRVLDNVEKCLEHPANAADRFLLGFETDGRSITAIGNPDTAKATVVFVPGTFTNDEKLNDHLTKTGLKNLFGLLDRVEKPGYMEISQRIWYQLLKRLHSADVAVVDYQNYHAPQDLANPLSGAPNPRFAEEGAPALRNHLDRLHDNNRVGEVWVAGHSYGTVLVGESAKGHHGLNADGLINLGSPGLRVHDVSGLQLKGQHLVPGQAPVHTMTRVDDPIHLVDGARRTGLAHFGIGHGLMPHHPEFGGHVWRVDTNAGAQADPHNAYFLPDSVALENIAKIVAGEPPPPQTPVVWSTRHSLPFTTGYFRPPPDESWSAEQSSEHLPELTDPQRHRLGEYERAMADPRESR